LAEIGLGYEKNGFRRTKAVISLKRSKIGPRLVSLLLTTNAKCYTHFRLCQNQQPWMTLKVIIVSKMWSQYPLKFTYLLYFVMTFVYDGRWLRTIAKN